MATTARMYKQNNVNTQRIVDEINEFVISSASELGLDWNDDEQRNSFADVCGWWLSDFVENNIIVQYKVLCDRRNNKDDDMKSGIFYVDLYFKQKNCLNTTQITYKITHMGGTSFWGMM